MNTVRARHSYCIQSVAMYVCFKCSSHKKSDEATLNHWRLANDVFRRSLSGRNENIHAKQSSSKSMFSFTQLSNESFIYNNFCPLCYLPAIGDNDLNTSFDETDFRLLNVFF